MAYFIKGRHFLVYNSKRYSSTSKILPFQPLSAPAYKPAIVEKNINTQDDHKACAENDGRETFSMVLPPPNITGKLHLGHALSCTIQDVIARWQRMQGKNVLWLPGTDHAGIATQGVVEKNLATKNISKSDLTREEFNKHVWQWKSLYGESICSQLRSLGLSLDWSRYMFTMDERHASSVEQAFIRLYEKGLIYRKKSLVNWCVALRSTISDIEVDNMNIEGPTDVKVPGYHKKVKFGLLSQLKYNIKDSNESIEVATTRLETMLGDVAIAVHPEDQRYQHLRGKYACHPIRHDTIPIIFDKSIDMTFGTGAVKITPAHDRLDYDIAQRHNLKFINVINENGSIEQNFEDFSNMSRFECRIKMEQYLRESGLFVDNKPHKMVLPVCSRTGDIIELLPKEQWYINCKELSKAAKNAVTNGSLSIKPDIFEKNWLQWTSDERDWCISRQLWWGHQIPAYFCTNLETNESIWIAAGSKDEARTLAASKLDCDNHQITLERDTDVLDTWFSSGIYPFSSLGWPEITGDYQKFYPLNVMVTGHDILGFWVYRMVILGLVLTDQLPFSDVLLHGIICDSRGAKMSKSKGNVLDPMDVINGISYVDLCNKYSSMYKGGVINQSELEKAMKYCKSNYPQGINECGVDALRFTMMSRDFKSHFVHFDLDLCYSNKLFCNKLWQSVKYCQLSAEKLRNDHVSVSLDDLTVFDRWILSKLSYLIDGFDKNMQSHDFHLVTKELKEFLYYDFCDFYLETTKLGFENNLNQGYAHLHTLSLVLNTGLRLLSPFMIYLPKELLNKIPNFERNVIIEMTEMLPPKDFRTKWRDESLESKMNKFIDLVSLIRQLKGFYTIPNRVKPDIIIFNCDTDLKSILKQSYDVFNFITRTSNLKFDVNVNSNNSISGFLDNECRISLILPEDYNAKSLVNNVQIKLEKRMVKLNNNLLKLNEKIRNKGYKEKTPEQDQMTDEEKLKLLSKELDQLKRFSSL